MLPLLSHLVTNSSKLDTFFTCPESLGVFIILVFVYLKRKFIGSLFKAGLRFNKKIRFKIIWGNFHKTLTKSWVYASFPTYIIWIEGFAVEKICYWDGCTAVFYVLLFSLDSSLLKRLGCYFYRILYNWHCFQFDQYRLFHWFRVL